MALSYERTMDVLTDPLKASDWNYATDEVMVPKMVPVIGLALRTVSSMVPWKAHYLDD